MPAQPFRLDRRGVAEILKRPVVNDVAQQVAGSAGEDAELSFYTTDRAAASVSVPAEQQARDGVLTRAAAAAGLEVRAR